MTNHPLPGLDRNKALHDFLLPYCRLRSGEVWQDTAHGHRIGCLDAASERDIETLMDNAGAALAIHDPPYNLVAFDVGELGDFIRWCEKWVRTSDRSLLRDASLYIWLGADQNNAFQPLPDFMMMMRQFRGFQSRSLITMRNQRGYGELCSRIRMRRS